MLDEIKTTSPDRQQPAFPTRLTERERLEAHVNYEKLKILRDACREARMIAWYELEWHGDHYESVLRKGELSWANVRKSNEEGLLYVKLNDGRWYVTPRLDHLSNEHLLHFLGCNPVGDWRSILNKYGLWNLRNCVTQSVYKGKRSSIIFKIGRTLSEAGATDDEIKMVLRASRCWQDKRGKDERALHREVQRIMQWRPMNCGNSTCANANAKRGSATRSGHTKDG